MPRQETSAESKYSSSEPTPSLTEISASLADDLSKGKDHPRSDQAISTVESNTRQLIAAAKNFNFLAIDPFRIVGDIIAALKTEHFKTTNALLKLLLAQALHLYVDFAVMRMFQDDAYKVHILNKDQHIKDLIQVLKDLKGVKGNIHTIEIQYFLLCAEAGISALKDSHSWADESIAILKLLGKIFTGKDLATNAAALQELFSKRQKLWYIHILEIRVLTSLAQHSVQHLDRLRQFMADPEVANSSEWMIHYAMQDALADVVMTGASYTLRQTAFSGNNSGKALPCLQQLAARALTPPFFDQHEFFYYRSVAALVQFAQHPESSIRQQAMAILAKAVNRPLAQALTNVASQTLLPVQFINVQTPTTQPSFPKLEEAKGSSESIPAKKIHAAIMAGDAAVTAGNNLTAVQYYFQALSALEKLAKDTPQPTGVGKVMSRIAGGVKGVLHYASAGKLFAKGIDPIAALKVRIEQLWAIEFYYALYPLIVENTCELGGSTTLPDKLHLLVTPLYQLLQRHQLSIATESLDLLLTPHRLSSVVASDEKPIWIEVQSKFQQLQETLRQVKDFSRSQEDLQAYTQGMQKWLGECVEQAAKLLVAAPCGFSFMLLGTCTNLVGITAAPLSVAVLIDNDFYRDHPYFQSLLRLVSFITNGMSAGLLKLEVASAQEMLGTPKNLITRALQHAPETRREFYATTPLYANKAGNKLFDNYQTELAQTLDQTQTGASVSLAQHPGNVVTLKRAVAPEDLTLETKETKHKASESSEPDTISLAHTLSLGSDAEEKEKTKPSEPPKAKQDLSSLPHMLSLGSEAEGKEETKRTNVGMSVFQERKGDPADEKGSVAFVLPSLDEKVSTDTVFIQRLRHQVAKAAAEKRAAYYSSLRETQPNEYQGLGQRCLTSLTSWCQTLTLYFKLTDANGKLLQTVPAILQQAKDQGLLVPAFAQELQAIWELGHLLHLQKIVHHKPKNSYKRLLDLEQHTLQPAWQTLSLWLEITSKLD